MLDVFAGVLEERSVLAPMFLPIAALERAALARVSGQVQQNVATNGTKIQNDARQVSGRRFTALSTGGAMVKMRGPSANRCTR